jgi:hypothetical protein
MIVLGRATTIVAEGEQNGIEPPGRDWKESCLE